MEILIVVLLFFTVPVLLFISISWLTDAWRGKYNKNVINKNEEKISEILDRISVKDIENYLRKIKLKNLKK